MFVKLLMSRANKVDKQINTLGDKVDGLNTSKVDKAAFEREQDNQRENIISLHNKIDANTKEIGKLIEAGNNRTSDMFNTIMLKLGDK